ncbi:NAD(P)-dependent alcohol dehydrogenase [Agrococcus sp. ARC_14]|uniref:NAD(P)-dependent alcohol dehydrogenase n=1 Tax=Agrococcus sp. ARC_14 TaxID=2919927 RepID=UPI001F051CF5|nr:NAD(P)-dependent alcohol dehydrogenase [Agrococcus sp. ARC_14]MCH1882810.1 NAD(P)-dependent alcohol dehydrogenase [Agrococcus sp. ARC_14]
MPILTKALQKTAPDQPYRVAQIERRDPRPNDVVIAIKAAGICHSDIHTIRDEWGKAPFPLTVGHEIAGIVEAIGDAVTRHAVGDRVGVGCLVDSCGECEQCLADEEQDCLQGNVGTYASVDRDGTITQGGYAEHVVVDERFVLGIPKGIELDVAAPLLCAGITLYSPIDRWGVGEGKRVAVIGLGGLGHMGVQISAAKGAEVIVLSRSLAKESLAAELGASRTVATGVEGWDEELRGSFDVILNTVSADLELDRYLRLLKPHGAMVNVGLPPGPQSIKLGSLINGGKVLAGSNIGGIRQTQEMLDFCAAHGIGAMIETIGVDAVDEAYDRVVAGDVQFRFVIDTATFADAEAVPLP